MRTFLKEFGMSILTSFIGLVLILLMSPVGKSLGTSLTNIVRMSGESGSNIVAAITPSEEEVESNEYDNIDTWYGVENTLITYTKLSGNTDINVVHTENKIEISCKETIKSATLDDGELEINDGIITLTSDFITDENYHQLICVTEEENTLVYVFRA